MFRDGVIETAASGRVDLKGNELNQYIPIQLVEADLIAATTNYLTAFRALGLGLPISVHVTLSGVKGKRIPLDRLMAEEPEPIDRDMLILPHILIDDEGRTAAQILRPVFDALWQSSGYERCLHFHAADGSYHVR